MAYLRISGVLVLIGLISLNCVAGQKKGILFPRDSESRQSKNLDGLWNFRAEPKAASDLGISEKWFEQPLEKVTIIIIAVYVVRNLLLRMSNIGNFETDRRRGIHGCP